MDFSSRPDMFAVVLGILYNIEVKTLTTSGGGSCHCECLSGDVIRSTELPHLSRRLSGNDETKSAVMAFGVFCGPKRGIFAWTLSLRLANRIPYDSMPDEAVFSVVYTDYQRTDGGVPGANIPARPGLNLNIHANLWTGRPHEF